VTEHGNNLGGGPLPYMATIVRNQDAFWCLQKLAGQLFQLGHDLNWDEVNSSLHGSEVNLQGIPPYPWDYSSGTPWFEPRLSQELRQRRYARHELLGSQQAAGNGINWNWRNVLRLDEVPWLRDHKVENQIVFPAAGYIAIAMEAVSQIQEASGRELRQSAAYNLHNVGISTALVVPEDEERDGGGPELHTTISWRKLSTRSESSKIYDFSKAKESGLIFGPSFQSLTSIRSGRNTAVPEVICTSKIEPENSCKSSFEYPVHPITIDAALQAAIASNAAGDLSALQAYLPVFISDCRIQSVGSTDSAEELEIHAKSKKTGFSSLLANVTMRSKQRMPVVDMKGIQLSMYQGKIVQSEVGGDRRQQRVPILRVHWKPDLLRLGPGCGEQLTAYVSGPEAVRPAEMAAFDDTTAVIGALLDLLGHKNPRMSVLELADGQSPATQSFQQMLGQGTGFRRYRSWHAATLGKAGEPLVQNGSAVPYDIVINNVSQVVPFMINLSV
jgi:hypothetical protein